MASIKSIKDLIAKKKMQGVGSSQPTAPNGPDITGKTDMPEYNGDMQDPTQMGAGPVPPMMGGTQDPQAMLEEGRQKVLEGLAEMKQAQAQMGGGVQ